MAKKAIQQWPTAEDGGGDNKVRMWTTWTGMLQIEDNNMVQDNDEHQWCC